MTAKMQIRNLEFYYGKFLALKNINIDIADKKMYEAKQNGRNQTKYEGEDRC